MNGNEPITKADLNQAFDRVIEAVGVLRVETTQKTDQLRSEMAHNYNDLVERIADSETRVLKSIYNISEAGNRRIVGLEDADAILRQRLGLLETRLLEVEKRLNLPPAA